MEKTEFLNDLVIAQKWFPFIEYDFQEGKLYPYKITDDFEVSDDNGNHWGTFRASIHFPNTYPKGAPIMQDLSKSFPWEDDWHISSKTGECCVCGPIEKEEKSIIGNTIEGFIKSYVIPFYANQIYKKEYGQYKNGEYSHHAEGIWEDLEVEFQTKDRTLIVKYIEQLKHKRGRNEDCFCGSGRKYKRCHLDRNKYIEALSKELKI